MKTLQRLRKKMYGVLRRIDFRFGKKPKTKSTRKEEPKIYPLW